MSSKNQSNKKCSTCEWKARGMCPTSTGVCESWFPKGHAYHKSVGGVLVQRVRGKEYRWRLDRKVKLWV